MERCIHTWVLYKNKVILFNGDGECKHVSCKKFITEYHKIVDTNPQECDTTPKSSNIDTI